MPVDGEQLLQLHQGKKIIPSNILIQCVKKKGLHRKSAKIDLPINKSKMEYVYVCMKYTVDNVKEFFLMLYKLMLVWNLRFLWRKNRCAVTQRYLGRTFNVKLFAPVQNDNDFPIRTNNEPKYMKSRIPNLI